jgi:beta-glucanase (GH16 family)
MPPAGYALTFDDEFAGSTLDLSKWHPSWQWGTLNDTYPNDEALAQNISLSNGSAHFTVTKGATPSGRTYGAAVATTAGLFSQKYGYWEARVKMPANAHGIWPAFWLVATDGTWPPEIDIMEWLGNAPTLDDMTVHYGSTNQSAESIFAGPDFSADYHVLGLLWTASELDWYVDGVKQFTTTAGIPTKPLQIILNNSTGGWNNNVVDSTTAFPASFDVDYVRVYAGGSQSGGTAAGPDTTAPSTPSHLAATAQSTQVALTWSASTDNTGVKGYRVFRNTSLIGTAASNSYLDKQVSPSTRYVYAVAAFDAASNVSPQSASLSVTTPATSRGNR